MSIILKAKRVCSSLLKQPSGVPIAGSNVMRDIMKWKGKYATRHAQLDVNLISMLTKNKELMCICCDAI